MNLPIRVRLTVLYVVFLALILTAVGTFVVLRLESDLTRAVDRSLNPAADEIAAGYHAEGTPEFRDAARSVLTGERAAAQILDRSGRVAATYGDRVATQPMIDREEVRSALAGSRLIESESLNATDFRVIARRVTRRGEQQVLVAAESLAPVNRSVNRVILLLLIAFPVALAATALAGWWLARRALRPIDEMTSTAAAIGPDDLQERVPVPGTADEVAHLATTLNTMLDRIQGGVEAQRRLVADTSHELRTPLAALRTEIDVSLRSDELTPAAREVLESAREEVDHMNTTIEDLLTLARADEGRLQLRDEQIDLHDVAFDAVRALNGLALRRGVVLQLEGETASTRGDPDRLRQLLRNLIDNAIKFSPEGGRVVVSSWSSAAEAGVTVADEGPGVPAEMQRRIFDRYFRVDGSRTRATGGSGLGLAIADELVVAHGGRIDVENRTPRGSAFKVALPARDARVDDTGHS